MTFSEFIYIIYITISYCIIVFAKDYSGGVYMIELKNGRIDVTKLELGDIIDRDILQSFLDDFAIGMNCAAVSVGRKGEEFTHPSHYRPFCSNFIHASHIGDKRCAECHNRMGEEAIKLGKPYIGLCHAGLIDFAAPVIIDGEHLGTVLGGQILDTAADERTIRKVASEIDVSEDGLWKASEQIDIVPRRNIEAAASVLYIVVNALAKNGYSRIETELLSSNLAENFIQISETIEMLAETAQSITGSQHTLVSEIEKINEATKEITNVLQSITKVADKTKLLGLNASIEAARIGNEGRGFAIVAEEIRNLSENTKETAKNISLLNTAINKRVGQTKQNADDTMGIIEDQSAAMEELSAAIQDSVGLAEGLRDLFKKI